jgi:hypothetical protein
MAAQQNEGTLIGFLKSLWNEWVWPLRFHILIIAAFALVLVLLSNLA